MYSKHLSVDIILDRQRIMLYTPHYVYTSIYWLSSWNRNSIFQIYGYDWAKK